MNVGRLLLNVLLPIVEGSYFIDFLYGNLFEFEILVTSKTTGVFVLIFSWLTASE